MQIIPNTTRVLAVQIFDLGEPQPLVFLAPVIAWRVGHDGDRSTVMAPDLSQSYDALHDAATGATWDSYGGVWATLEEAAAYLVDVLRKGAGNAGS